MPRLVVASIPVRSKAVSGAQDRRHHEAGFALCRDGGGGALKGKQRWRGTAGGNAHNLGAAGIGVPNAGKNRLVSGPFDSRRALPAGNAPIEASKWGTAAPVPLALPAI